LALLTLHGPVSADAALALQLVHQVVEDDALALEALRLAHQLAAVPPQAARELKALVYAPSIDSLAQHLAREKAAFQRCAATPDFAARVAAFAGRSAPA
jgi:2-(1,2-epoxy-1,2-dihydrophenyl)acetyl-CoA isomerase